jgi:tetratricopeptide (TPR) repeat protein
MTARQQRGGRVAVFVWLCLAAIARPASAASTTELTALERQLSSDPENLRVAADYRQLALGASNLDRAIDLLEKLAKRKGSGPNVQISLALAYVDKVPTSGDVRRLYLGRDAMNALTKAIDRQPSALAYYVRGLINLYYNNFIFKRIPRGLEDLKKALTLVSADTPAILVSRIYISMGDGYWKLQDRAKARDVWSQGVSKFSDNAELKRRLESDLEKVRWIVTDALDASTRVDTSLRGVVPTP